jgi:hypothetical protein
MNGVRRSGVYAVKQNLFPVRHENSSTEKTLDDLPNPTCLYEANNSFHRSVGVLLHFPTNTLRLHYQIHRHKQIFTVYLYPTSKVVQVEIRLHIKVECSSAHLTVITMYGLPTVHRRISLVGGTKTVDILYWMGCMFEVIKEIIRSRNTKNDR